MGISDEEECRSTRIKSVAPPNAFERDEPLKKQEAMSRSIESENDAIRGKMGQSNP
jgi:hypothetical protein